jgi:hypothetical protein
VLIIIIDFKNLGLQHEIVKHVWDFVQIGVEKNEGFYDIQIAITPKFELFLNSNYF